MRWLWKKGKRQSQLLSSYDPLQDGDDEMSGEEPVVTFLFGKKGKGRGRPSALRKTPAQDDTTNSTTTTTATGSTSEVILATKKTALNHLVQGTVSLKRRRAAQDDAAQLSEDDDEEVVNSFAVRHSATTSRPRRRSSSPPAEMSRESITAGIKGKEVGEDTAAVDDGLYRGSKGMAHQLPKSFGGPVKGGPGNVRTITLMDYQPDVCKDYKETGFCGFGDTCKFLHDRGDYLHGWQLDNQFLSSSAAAGSFLAKQAARQGGQADSDDDSENEDLPFACLICRKPFGKEPVVTLCGHYFDSTCAVKRFAKTGKCFACGKGTNGVFNKATKLIAQVKERERLEAAAEAEGDDSDAGEDGGVEIEGLGAEGGQRAPRRNEKEESGSEEEDDVPKPVKRRPIIELQ